MVAGLWSLTEYGVGETRVRETCFFLIGMKKIGIIQQILHCLDCVKKWWKTHRNRSNFYPLIEMITFELCHEVYKRTGNITWSDVTCIHDYPWEFCHVKCLWYLYFVDVNVLWFLYNGVSRQVSLEFIWIFDRMKERNFLYFIFQLWGLIKQGWKCKGNVSFMINMFRNDCNRK